MVEFIIWISLEDTHPRWVVEDPRVSLPSPGINSRLVKLVADIAAVVAIDNNVRPLGRFLHPYLRHARVSNSSLAQYRIGRWLVEWFF